MPCSLRQDGGCKNATPGFQIALTTMTSRFDSIHFHSRNEGVCFFVCFFKSVPNNKDLLLLDWYYNGQLQMPEGD